MGGGAWPLVLLIVYAMFSPKYAREQISHFLIFGMIQQKINSGLPASLVNVMHMA